MSLSYASEGSVTIKTDEARLAEIDAAISDLLTTGQSYTMFGSRQVTRADLGGLEKLRSRYERRILMAKGVTGRNHADGRGQANLNPGDVDHD